MEGHAIISTFYLRFSPKRLEAPLISLAKRRMKETSYLGTNDLFEQMKSLKAHDNSDGM